MFSLTVFIVAFFKPEPAWNGLLEKVFNLDISFSYQPSHTFGNILGIFNLS